MTKFANFKRILSFTLGLVMLLNIIAFSPFATTEAEAAAAVAGTDYKVITAAQLNTENAVTVATGTPITVSYSTNVISFKATEANGDPQTYINFTSFGISASTYKYIVFTGKTVTRSTNSTSELYYITTSNSLNGDNRGIFHTEVCGKYMSSVISVPASVTGTYTKCRFDVFSSVAAGDEYQLESVIFVDDYGLAQALAWQRSSSLNGDPYAATVFRGPGLANFMDTYNTAGNFNINNTNYNYTTYDVAENAVKIHAKASASDPNVVFNFSGVSSLITDFSATNYKYMVITYKAVLNNTHGSTTLQPFMNYSSANYSYVADPSYSVLSDGQYHSVIVDLADVTNWTGAITEVRLDYLGQVYAGESFYIDSIGFYKSGNNSSGGLREAAGKAAKNNVLSRKGDMYNGKIYAYYDVLGMIDEYNWTSHNNHYYEYDSNEKAIKITAKQNNGDPHPAFDLSNTNILTSNTRYVVITYMIPEGQKFASGKAWFTSSVKAPTTDSEMNSLAVSYNLIADGKYHSYVIDLQKMTGYSNSSLWGDNITKLRLDYVDGAVNAGEYIYLDSILFLGNDLTTANRTAWEIYEKRTYEEGKFIASPETMPMFVSTQGTISGGYYGDAVTVSFDETEDAAKIEAKKDASDVQVNFRFTSLTDTKDNLLAALNTSKYNYVVVTYKANRTESSKATGTNMQIYPYTTGTNNSASPDLAPSYSVVDDTNEYHALVFPVSDYDLWTGTTSGLRLDFFDNVKVGDVMYVDSIIYCNTLDEAYQTAWDRTWFRNHEKINDSGINTADGTFDHWEQMYLIDSANDKRGKTGGDVVRSEYKDELTINGSTATNEGGVKVTGNETLTYNISNLGLTADKHKFIIITYKLTEGTYNYKDNTEMLDTAIKSKVSNVVCNFSINADGLGKDKLTFTEQIFGNTDIGLVDGNEFHAVRIDLSAPTYNTLWTGNINSFTIQFDDLYSDDDSRLEVYIESVVFAGDNEKASGQLAYGNVNKINGISEKTTEGDQTAYLYYATPEMVYLFGGRHMCEASYDEAHMAVKLTICNYCTSTMVRGYHHAGNPATYTCTSYCFDYLGEGEKYEEYADTIGAFDPMSYFYLMNDVPFEECDYLVVSYMTPSTKDGLKDLVGVHPNPDPAFSGDSTEYTYPGYVGIGIYPVLVGEGPSKEYVRDFKITDQSTYFSAYTDLMQSGLSANALTAIRIDPFQLTYARPGYSVYISTVALAKTDTNAFNLSEDQLNRFYPYSFSLSYNKGEGEGDDTIENFPDASSKSRTRQNSFSFNVSYATPTRANYEFVAWVDEDGNVTPAGDPVVLKSNIEKLEDALLNPAAAAVSAELTAQWEEKEATLTYKIIGPEGIVGCATLSGTDFEGEDLMSSGTQSVSVLTGTPEAITVTPSASFMFIGWYADEDCTVPITNQAELTVAMMTAYKEENLDSTSVDTYPTVWADVTFYAKVDYVRADLTIYVEKDAALEADQNFIINIEGTGIHNSIDFSTLTVIPTEIVEKDGVSYYKIIIKQLYGGTYTVTMSDWNWRYQYSSPNQVEIYDSAVEFTFSYGSVSNEKWLNSYGYSIYPSTAD